LGKAWLNPIVAMVKSSRVKLPALGPLTGKFCRPRSSVGSGRRSAATAEERAPAVAAARALRLGALAAASLSACS
jgi:hypothetical protein